MTYNPVPFFKYITELVAAPLGIEIILPAQSLLLNVPNGLNLDESLFSFLKPNNLLTFNSDLNQSVLSINLLQTLTYLAENAKIIPDNMLSVVVTAYRPRLFLRYALERGVVFSRQEPWLWQGKVGFQEAAIVVCCDLPIRPAYYGWLAFAPPDSRKWLHYLAQLLTNKESQATFLQIAQKLHPMEYTSVEKSFEQAVADKLNEPEFNELLEEDRIQRTAYLLETLSHEQPDSLANVLANLKPIERLAGLTVEERLIGLSAEERLSVLGLKEHLANLSVEERLTGLSPSERLAGLDSKQRLEMLRLLLQQTHAELPE